MPGIEDAGEFSASLARYKRYQLLALGLSEKTVRDRCYTVERLNRWLRRERGVDALTASEDDLLEWAMSLGWKASSRCTEVGRMKAFYRWRHRVEHVPDDPSRDIPLPARPRLEPHPIEDDVLARALHHARGLADWRIAVALILAAFCGLRVGEIARLRREDFHRDRRTGRITIQVTGKGRAGGKRRMVPISPAVFELLIDCGLPGGGPIMPRIDGKPGAFLANSASSLLNKWLHRVVGTDYTFHSLRHWFGTEMYDETRDLAVVQQLMGHGSPRTTTGYVKIIEARSESSVDVLDARLPELGLAPVHDLAERRRHRAEREWQGGGGGSGHRDDARRARRPHPTVADPAPYAHRELEVVQCRQLERPRDHDHIR